MTVILTCGHSCDVRPHGISIFQKAMARDGTPAVSYSHYCHKCYVEAVSESPDMVLFDQAEVDEFLVAE